jgi:dTDP-4-amino-4,6-dideoxygalactose transaminase
MIPLSIPNLSGNENEYVSDCIKYIDAQQAVACMNGTVGLQTALNVLGINKEDLVLTTNLTFVATLNAISYTGAKPILFDINRNTWQIDLDIVEEWLFQNTHIREIKGKPSSYHNISQKRIGAIVPVHVLGAMVDIDKLLDISDKYNIPIVEDSTEALGSTYQGKHAGTFGKLGVFSFNGNKIISTGGGGMIVTNDKILAKKSKHITTTAKTDPLDYFHDEVGFNYRLVNVLAAIGVAQMEQFSTILEKKKIIDQRYRKELDGIADIKFQKHLPNTDPNCWLFTFRTSRMRKLLDFLNSNGIQSRPFWTPMNQLPMYSKLEYVNAEDITGEIFSECISIPSSSNLTESQQEEVINTIRKFYQK